MPEAWSKQVNATRLNGSVWAETEPGGAQGVFCMMPHCMCATGAGDRVQSENWAKKCIAK